MTFPLSPSTIPASSSDSSAPGTRLSAHFGPRARFRLSSRFRAALLDDEGAATAEYAIATMAAVGLAGLLVVILKGDAVKAILTDLVTRALTFAG